MSDTFKLAMQLTMVDMLSGVVKRARQSILSLGSAGKEVQRDFDLMTSHLAAGLKSVAVAKFGLNKMKPGVAAAADLQEALIDVRMALMRSGKDAAVLNSELAEVRSTAIELQKITPFSAQDVVEVQKELMTSGLDFNEVVGKGAARAAMMLATITKASPGEATESMLNVGVPYGLKSNEYVRLADVIQRHVMSGRLKIPDLNTNLKYVAGMAAQKHIPWEDLLTGMAVLGEQGMASNSGIEMKDFLERLTGVHKEQRKVQQALNQYLVSHGKAPLKFWENGKLKPLYTIIKDMRAAFADLTDEKKAQVLQRIFESRGGLAAVALMKEGVGGWEFIKDKVENVAGAEEKMTERLKGFNASVIALGGTAKTTLATLFDPMLNGLTPITQTLNGIVGAIGDIASKKPILADVFSGLASGAVAAAGIYGAYRLGQAAFYGRRVMNGVGGLSGLLRGLGGTALGITEGKIAEAATGVQPVFVTNFPPPMPGIPIVSGTVATTAMFAPALLAGIAAAVSIGIGHHQLNSEVQASSTERLKALRKQHEVLGGGTNTEQVKAIDKELRRRGINPEGMRWGGGQMLAAHKALTEKDRLIDEIIRKNGGAVTNDIKLDLQIDGNGQVTSRTNDMNTHITTVKRGNFFEHK